MDFRACNAVTRIIEGDVRTLASAPALQHVVMPSGSVLRLSAEAAFYLFSLPEDWSQLMCFEKKVSWKSLGEDRPGSTWIGACVLPMGWSSAVGVITLPRRSRPTSGDGGTEGHNLPSPRSGRLSDRVPLLG